MLRSNKVWLIPPSMSLTSFSFYNSSQFAANHCNSAGFLGGDPDISCTASVFLNGLSSCLGPRVCVMVWGRQQTPFLFRTDVMGWVPQNIVRTNP